MLINLDDKRIPEKIGNKAKYLMVMLSIGFNVPNGFVLDSDTYDEIISFNDKEKQIAYDERVDKNLISKHLFRLVGGIRPDSGQSAGGRHAAFQHRGIAALRPSALLRHMTPAALARRCRPTQDERMQRNVTAGSSIHRGRRMCACCCRALPLASALDVPRCLACCR